MGDQGGLPGIGDPLDEVISQRSFAALVKVSGPAITKAIAAGRLSAECVCETKRGKQLYLHKALAEWDAVHGDPAPSLLTEDLDGLTAQAEEAAKGKWGAFKTQQEALLAEARRKRLELETAEIEGMLHHASDVRLVWEARIEAAKSVLLGIPGEVCGDLGLRLKKDQIVVNEVLSATIERICAGLAADLKPEIREQRGRRVGKKR